MGEKPELLAPAGNFEKLRYALHYGADAVYCGGSRFGLRARADNFDDDGLAEAVAYTHGLGKKIYVTLNMIPRDEDFAGLPEMIDRLARLKVDAVLVADPGVFSVVRERAPSLKVSISTQANNTNSASVAFWHRLGAGRIVLARELSGQAIRSICRQAPQGMEIQTFVHGAMCISYSGRCLLSHYLTGRDANKGDCAQPCRWRYHLVEDTRPGEVMTIEEGDAGTFLFNSKDLCLARQIPQLMDAGVASFKIEGRMKSPYYVATVVSVYRRIIDAAWDDPAFVVPDAWVDELTKVSHRHYTTAFYDGRTGPEDQNYGTGSYTRPYDFIGVVVDYDPASGLAEIEQRNRLVRGDALEIISAGSGALFRSQQARELWDMAGDPIDATPHPTMHYRLRTDFPVAPMDILRRAAAES